MKPIIRCQLVMLSCFLLVLFCAKKSPDHQLQLSTSISNLVETPLILSKEIVQTPASPLSVSAVIEIGFREPVVPEHLAGVVLDKNPFEFFPSIKGKATWISFSKLRFTPERAMPPGTAYKAQLNGMTAFGANRSVDNFNFTFKTAEQEVVGFMGDFEPDTSGKNMVRFKGVLSFAQKAEVTDVSKSLLCKIKNRKVDLSLHVTAADPLKIIVISHPLKRGAEGNMLVFTLPEKYTVNKGAWRKEVYLPESNVFKVLTRMDMSEPDAKQRVYGFRFTDPVKTSADLTGFIEITPSINFALTVSGKYLKIRGPFEPGKNYSIVIAKGLPSALNTTLAEEFRGTFTFDNIKPQIAWLSEGTMLPSSNDGKIQFKSVNVSRVHVKVTEIFNNNIGFFLQNNVLTSLGGAGYRSGEEGEGSYYYGGNSGYNDLDRAGKTIYTDSITIDGKANTWIRSELDCRSVFTKKQNSLFVVSLDFNQNMLCGECTNDQDNNLKDALFFADTDYYGNPCQEGYYYRSGTRHKLLVASDIAFTVKKARDGLHLYAVNAVEGKPAAGVECGLYTYQNQLITKLTTNNYGHLLFSGKTEGASYVRATGANALAMVKLDVAAWEINNFDVGGASEGEGGLNVFSYTDRGVHRPGDTVQLSCMVRYGRMDPDSALPVLLTVFNARNVKAFEAKGVCGANGLIHFAIPTGNSDPTGDWRAEIEIGGVKTYHTLKVEAVKPNRFKVNILLPDTLLNPDSFAGSIEARYLFGTPAADCAALVECSYESLPLQIAAFPDYLFSHPLRRYEARKSKFFEGTLDSNGKASFKANVEGGTSAGELIGAVATATVNEPGGGFTRQSKRFVIAPFSGYVGVKVPFRSQTARTGEKYSLPIVCVDVNGKPVSGHRLRVKHFFNANYWWWDYDQQNRRDFRAIDNTFAVDEQQFVSLAVPCSYTLNVEDYGQHLVEVVDETSGHSAGFFFFASDWGYTNAAKGTAPDRTFLEISTDRNMYAPGDAMTITFPSPAAGMAIVSIEVSDRILAQHVVALTAGKTSVKFQVGEAMVPNCYAVVSLVQPQRSTANDVPGRIYGIKTIFVEDRQSHLPLTVTAPEELVPNKPFTISVTSGATVPASYTLAVVDEGLLDLTGFTTPDPWHYYYQKIRLGVSTADNFDEIIGMLLPDMDRTFSIGGSEGIEMRSGATRVQRFKPVVFFTGPIVVKPGKTNRHTFAMPNYVGSVRVMVVGCAGKGFSSSEKTLPVRAPLMILPTVPRVARPLDQFMVPVSVFATEGTIGAVTLALKVSKELTVNGPSTLTILFDKPGERDTSFSVSVGAALGSASIILSARSGNNLAVDSVTLPLIAPNPFFTDVLDTVLQGEGW